MGFASLHCPEPRPEVVRAFRKSSPGVDLQLRELSSAAQVQALRDGQIDVGFIREPMPAVNQGGAELRCEEIGGESFVAVLPPEHPWRASGGSPASRWRRSPSSHFPRSVAPRLYDRILALCQEAGFQPRVVQEATNGSPSSV